MFGKEINRLHQVSPSWHRARRGISGFTIAELLIAIFVVAVGILGTTAALWYGIRSERYSERRSSAVFQSRELLNAIRSGGYADLPGYLAPGSDLNDGDFDNDADDTGPQRAFNAPPMQNYFPNNPYNFRRRVELKRLSTSSTNHLNFITAIKVTLFWDEGGQEKKLTLIAYN